MFDETLQPLEKFSNVSINRGFLSHKEISSLHKQFGIFITPTRMDSQGVSRDEAMSSGLVPITTDITAIPEFVDSESGILTPQRITRQCPKEFLNCIIIPINSLKCLEMQQKS